MSKSWRFSSIDEVELTLRPYQVIAGKTFGKSMTTERTERLLAHVGNPEQRLRIVHIAGTSGKTSTTYYVAALLNAGGYKVGYTVSPHVDSLTERVQINGAPLSEKLFCDYIAEFLTHMQSAPEEPSWYEFMTVFAFWVFERAKVDYAVIETGVGGLHDSTNVARRDDKVCVITDIGYDHMALLGDTLPKIAYQKAGIIHNGNVAIMYDQSQEIMQVMRYWVSQQEGAELLTFSQDRLRKTYKGQFAQGLPDFQQRNWLLAYAAYLFIAKRDELKQPDGIALARTQAVQVPGRMDERTIDDKTIVMDGAHNEQKMRAFIESFRRRHPGMRPVILLALKQGKEIEQLAPLLKGFASEVVVTTFTHAQDLPVQSIEPSEIGLVLQKYRIKNSIVPDQTKAYSIFLEKIDRVGVITGSFFLIAQLRSIHPELISGARNKV